MYWFLCMILCSTIMSKLYTHSAHVVNRPQSFVGLFESSRSRNAARTFLASRHIAIILTAQECVHVYLNVCQLCFWTQASCLSSFEESTMIIFGNLKIAPHIKHWPDCYCALELAAGGKLFWDESERIGAYTNSALHLILIPLTLTSPLVVFLRFTCGPHFDKSH